MCSVLTEVGMTHDNEYVSTIFLPTVHFVCPQHFKRTLYWGQWPGTGIWDTEPSGRLSDLLLRITFEHFTFLET